MACGGLQDIFGVAVGNGRAAVDKLGFVVKVELLAQRLEHRRHQLLLLGVRVGLQFLSETLTNQRPIVFSEGLPCILLLI